MPLILHYHPLLLLSQGLDRLSEKKTPLKVNWWILVIRQQSAKFLKLWPVGKIPVLRDEGRDRTIQETSIIIEYLGRFYPGPVKILPDGPSAGTRLCIENSSQLSL